MSSVINTNALSLLTQNNLNKSQGALNSAIERLSSGMRINSAKDDAAGQAIANRFTANIKGLTQAQRNANDGISLAQTTEGALSEVNTNLQRVRELSVQAANGSNSVADKASMQAEITQRMAEIDRLSAQTDFNGVKVLNSSQSLTIQVGAKDNEAISIALQKMDSGALNMRTFSVSGPDAAGQVSTAATVAAFLGKTVSATPAVAITIAAGSTGVADLGTVAPTAVVSMDSKGNYFAEVTAAAGTTRAGVVAGDKLYVAIDPASVTYTTGAPDTAVAAVVDFSAAGFAKSANALATVDAALAKVDTQRGALGAVQNRFDSVISNLGTTINNLSSSRSRIEDANYATEVSNMSRAQILQQAGTSVLAQANQTTQGVLSLLR
ncbi:FliC/FljB family flagellin [Polaromonas sp.]|jgi:flagellin|uniref:FliC/FljB family flagellin n=1 Tax=Polaromonas sp. TaxID=1869339 RepID=UPI002CE1D0B7|nr:FliC/FljB family flagellin [Polaromonas sp.]HQS31595.1 FliC/FljB family flagellin [Polaromonas sp.]HQS90074.1 FliC/FljB family flagellin [Polaromonas sp.]